MLKMDAILILHIKKNPLVCYSVAVPYCATTALNQQHSQVASKLVYHMYPSPNCGTICRTEACCYTESHCKRVREREREGTKVINYSHYMQSFRNLLYWPGHLL